MLIKWWLLAIPHYLMLVAFFFGGIRLAMGSGDDNWGDGTILVPLIRVLLLIAVVALLFIARYPKGLYDFVIGINRWAIRVLAYTSLMRDEYWRDTHCLRGFHVLDEFGERIAIHHD